MAILLKNVSKHFEHHDALETTNLIIEDAKTTVLIGPSGCGKSTLLRLIVGLIPPTEGKIFFGDVEVNDINISLLRRRIGYVIQDGGLFPHLNVKDNVSLFASYLGYSHKAIDERIALLCDLVHLPVSILHSYPLHLSGGERSRVSLMRALMLDPDYILLDEPLAALDPITRFELQQQLKTIFSYLRKTVILVTHDMREAAYLGSEIVLMYFGKIIQKGTFQNLIKSPAVPFVTEFIQAQQYPVELAC